MMNPSKKSLAVLISGRGSNMEAILNACAIPDYPAKIAVVISDREDAGGLETALNHDIPAFAFERQDYRDKQAHELAIGDAIEAHDCDLVCLAGFMRILSAEFVRKFEGRMINIHPSLLPDFKGLDTHQRAIDAGVSEHGCTVHWVNQEMDGGEIIAQAKVPVLPGDTAEVLAARVLQEEHKLYPEVISSICK